MSIGFAHLLVVSFKGVAMVTGVSCERANICSRERYLPIGRIIEIWTLNHCTGMVRTMRYQPQQLSNEKLLLFYNAYQKNRCSRY